MSQVTKCPTCGAFAHAVKDRSAPDAPPTLKAITFEEASAKIGQLKGAVMKLTETRRADQAEIARLKDLLAQQGVS